MLIRNPLFATVEWIPDQVRYDEFLLTGQHCSILQPLTLAVV